MLYASDSSFGLAVYALQAYRDCRGLHALVAHKEELKGAGGAGDEGYMGCMDRNSIRSTALVVTTFEVASWSLEKATSKRFLIMSKMIEKPDLIHCKYAVSLLQFDDDSLVPILAESSRCVVALQGIGIQKVSAFRYCSHCSNAWSDC